MKFGRYELREKLGSGAFGTVYRAYDEEVGREVALKIAPIRSDADAVRLRREPRAAGQLVHPHIVPVFRAGVLDRKLYIASALIRGVTLQAWIEKQRSAIAAGTCDYRKIAVIVRKLADALAHAHERGVIHRDVKPSNILIDEKGEPFLADFGLARLHESTSDVTAEGTVLGTATYMSPEQAAGDASQVGPASDQYSLGVVLYEMLSGEPPFQGPPVAVLYQVRHEQPPSLRGRRAPIPPRLISICESAMAKDPRSRFASLADMSRALADFAHQQASPLFDPLPPAAPPPTGADTHTVSPAAQETVIQSLQTIRTPGSATRFHKGRRRDNSVFWLLGSAGFVALLALGIVLWSIRGDRDGASARLPPDEGVRRIRTGGSNGQRVVPQPRNDELSRGNSAIDSPPGVGAADPGAAGQVAAAETDSAANRGTGAVGSPGVAERGEAGEQEPPEPPDPTEPPKGDAPEQPDPGTGRAFATGKAGEGTDEPADAAGLNEQPSTAPHPLSDRRALAVSARGSLAASIEPQGETVRLESFGAGEVADALPPLDGRTWALAFSDRARARHSLELATGGEDGILRLWNIAGKQPEQTYASEKVDAELFSLVFDNAGRPIAGDSRGRLLRWGRGEDQPQQIIPAEFGAVHRLVVSPDGKTLVSGHASGEVVRWMLQADEITDPRVLPQDEQLAGKSPIHALAFSPSESGRLAAGGADGVIRQWETANWQQRGLLRGPSSAVTGLQYSPLDDRILFSCSADGVRMWEVAYEDEWYALSQQDGAAAPVHGISLRGDGRLLFALGDGLQRWELKEDLEGGAFQLRAPARKWSHPLGHRLESIVFSPNAMAAAATSLHDPDAQNQPKVLKLHLLNVVRGVLEWEAAVRPGVGPRCAAFHPTDRRILATGANDYRVYRWNLQDRSFAPLSDRLGRDVTSVAYSPDGNLLVAGSYDSKVTILNGRTGAPLLPPFEKHMENAQGQRRAELHPLYYVSFVRDTGHVLSCSGDSVMLWKWDPDKARFDVLRRWDHEQERCYATLSADGRFAVVGLRKSRLEVWDLREPEKVRADEARRLATLTGDAEDFELSRGLAISDQGRFVATGQSGTGEICVWSVGSGERLLRYRGHERLVEQVVFSPVGARLASCDELGTVLFLDIGSWHEVKTDNR